MKSIPLAELEGKLGRTRFTADLTLDALTFVCPICLDAAGGERPGVHSHIVPFRFGEPQVHDYKPITLVWGHISGSNIKDITLAPSYLARSSVCRLHCFIRQGQVEVLSDSQKV